MTKTKNLLLKNTIKKGKLSVTNLIYLLSLTISFYYINLENKKKTISFYKFNISDSKLDYFFLFFSLIETSQQT